MASPIQFLIDECLSPELAEALSSENAHFVHVNHRGLNRASDAKIARWCIANEHILVTNNARDFRAIYASLDLHPGLVILLPSVRIARAIELVRLVLPVIFEAPDMVNKMIQIDDEGRIEMIDWPAK